MKKKSTVNQVRKYLCVEILPLIKFKIFFDKTVINHVVNYLYNIPIDIIVNRTET